MTAIVFAIAAWCLIGFALAWAIGRTFDFAYRNSIQGDATAAGPSSAPGARGAFLDEPARAEKAIRRIGLRVRSPLAIHAENSGPSGARRNSRSRRAGAGKRAAA